MNKTLRLVTLANLKPIHGHRFNLTLLMGLTALDPFRWQQPLVGFIRGTARAPALSLGGASVVTNAAFEALQANPAGLSAQKSPQVNLVLGK